MVISIVVMISQEWVTFNSSGSGDDAKAQDGCVFPLVIDLNPHVETDILHIFVFGVSMVLQMSGLP